MLDPATLSNAVGSSFPVALDPSSMLLNGGSLAPIQENAPGTLTLEGTLSIMAQNRSAIKKKRLRKQPLFCSVATVSTIAAG